MAETNPDQPVGNWHYEWREISNPYADFNQTKLYDVLTDFFSQLGHTHQKSDITNFSHTHQKSEITDFAHTHTGWQEISGFGDAHLYVNNDIRLAELRWKYTNTTARSVGAEILYRANGATAYIPSDYRPSTIIVNNAHNGYATIRADSSGLITVRFTSAVGDSGDYHFSLMWHY